MGSRIRCPRCQSPHVECIDNADEHTHRCFDCGFTGRYKVKNHPTMRGDDQNGRAVYEGEPVDGSVADDGPDLSGPAYDEFHASRFDPDHTFWSEVDERQEGGL